MKILFLCGGDHKYGTPRMALSFITKIRNEYTDFEFIVLTADKGLVNDTCNELGIENYVIPYRYCVYKKEDNRVVDFLKRLVKGTYILANLEMSLQQLKKQVDIKRIDLIHTNINRDLFGEYIARRYHKPHIVHLREFSKKHFGLSLLFPHQLSFMNKYTDRFVVISNTVARDWESYGIDSSKITLIYDGVDPDDVKYNKNKEVSEPIKIVMCGGIYTGKGQRQLVEAMHLLKDKGFHVLLDFFGGEEGTSGYYGLITDDIKKYHLEDSVHMRGYQKDVRKRICEYDIGVVCSKAEGFGLVTVEYMFAGLCPIVSDTGANIELVKDGESGLVYKWGEPEDLADKIAELVKNRDKLTSLAKNARKRALEYFSLKNSVDNLTAVYYDVQKMKSV